MTKRHRPAASADANKVMPDGLTEIFFEKIMALPSSVKTDYLKREIFSKFISNDTEPGEVRRVRAINRWLSTERDNEATNERLLTISGEYNILPRVTFDHFIAFSRSLIRDIIGDTVPVDALIGSFSGGASTSRNRTESHPALKYLGKAHVTQAMLDVWLELAPDEMPTWLKATDFDLEYVIVPGNVLFTVPKKSDIDRCACKEPDVNMFVQKGIGNYFRRCLRSVGINLNDQSRNQSLARIGSITGELATLDLSSASDSISSGLVALLLPECWHTLLDASRSPVTIIDGEMHRNEMFSSMGNGFTFELESLLFYAIARSVTYFRGVPGVVSVYGDDIICPTPAADYLVSVLELLGFSINIEKSHGLTFGEGTGFSEGLFGAHFRESCGGHYYNGLDITPFYVRKPLTHLTDVIDVANKLRQWASIPGLSVLDCEVEDIWIWLSRHVPRILWGGEDTTYKYQLVSYDASHSKLVPETSRKKTGTGGYLQWLNATWDREVVREGVVTSSMSKDIGRHRLRRLRETAVPRLPSIFLHEIYR